MKRIVVCGSNSLLLAGLVATLDCQPQLNVVVSFCDADLFYGEDYRADILLLEQTPSLDWEWLERWLATTDSKIAGILLTDSLTTEEIGEYLDLGFLGFLPRSLDADEVIAAINTVMAGLIVIHPELALFKENAPAITPLPQPEINLTSREAEIIQLLGTGLDNKAIASHLGISKHTVKFHVSSILTKLDASSRTEAVTLGLKQGLIRL